VVRELPVLQEQQGLRVQPVLQDHREHQEQMVNQEGLVVQERLACRGHRVHLEPLDLRVLAEHQARPAPLVLLV